MSGTAGVSTQFQGAVTATGLQLDNNFVAIVSYLNDPTNRNNYAADGGTTNTLVINPIPPVVGGYTAGLTITFKAAFTSNGAVVANVSGLGNASVLDQQGRQLTSSAVISGSMYQMSSNGTAFYLLSPNNIVAGQPVLAAPLTSGVGTYTVSSGAVRLYVRGIGAGGGGGNGGGASGGTGGGTRFGTLLGGGGLGGSNSSGIGGAGGTATGATINIIGGRGQTGTTDALVVTYGGSGGVGPFGGAGGGSDGAGNQLFGPAPNTGAGGSGNGPSGGGGAGGYFEHSFTNPASTFSYTIGIGGSGSSGGNTGAAGIILISTFFA